MKERVFKALLILVLVGGVFSAYFAETQSVRTQVDTEATANWLRSKIRVAESQVVDELFKFAGQEVKSHKLRKKSKLRHFGEFKIKEGRTSSLWAMSRNSKKTNRSFLRRWENSLSKASLELHSLEFTLLRNGSHTYFVASYLHRLDDETKVIYSGVLDSSWLVPSLSEVIDGKTQIIVTDRGGVVAFSDRISRIGRRLVERVRPKISKENFDVEVVYGNPETAGVQSRVAFVLTLIGGLGLLSLLLVRRGRIEPVVIRERSDLASVLPEKARELPTVQKSEVQTRVEDSVGSGNTRELYDSLVVALVALRAEKSKHDENNIKVIEEQLRKMKTSLGLKVSLDDYEIVESSNEAVEVEEEETFSMNTVPDVIPEIPDVPPADLAHDWDQDFIVRRARVNEIEH